MKSSIACPSWVPLLVAYISGDGDFTKLYDAARKPLLRIVARIVPFLPDDLRDDVVQQVFIRLIENPPKYDPRQCSPRTLMYGLLRNAVRQVQATFAPSGQRTRIRKGNIEQGSQSPDVCITSEDQTADYESALQHYEKAPSSRWTAESMQASAQTSELLGRMPRDAGSATWLVYGLEYSITEAARMMNISRFAVARSLNQALRSAQGEIDASSQPEARRIRVAA